MKYEQNRRIENLIRLGRIKTVTLGMPFHTVTVDLGGIVTSELRVLNVRAGADKCHDLPSVGEECLVLSQDGELCQGVVLCGLNNDTFPTPSQNEHESLRVYADGAVVSYNSESHVLQAVLPAGGVVKVVADVQVDGTIRASGDVVAGSVSLKSHKHGGVRGGGDSSGVPQ